MKKMTMTNRFDFVTMAKGVRFYLQYVNCENTDRYALFLQ